jgi:hypothetical protein
MAATRMYIPYSGTPGCPEEGISTCSVALAMLRVRPMVTAVQGQSLDGPGRRCLVVSERGWRRGQDDHSRIY